MNDPATDNTVVSFGRSSPLTRSQYEVAVLDYLNLLSHMRQVQVNAPPDADEKARNCNQKLKEVLSLHGSRLIRAK